MENEEYIKKWLENSLTEEERTHFEQTEDYRFVQRLSGALKYFKAPAYHVQEEIIKLNQKKHLAVSTRAESHFLWLKVAATILIVMGVFWYIMPERSTKEEHFAREKRFVTLPDSSLVKLNNQSRLTFDPVKWNHTRQAYLEGEGFFVVKPGETFDILSQSGKVSVLGTSFNIKDRENFFEVKCYRGRVSVSTPLETVTLSRGQVYRIVDQVSQVSSYDLGKTPAWFNDESSFVDVPYIQVIEELERQYSVTVDAGSVNTKLRFTGKFTHSDLNLALKSMTIPMDIGYEVADRQVRLVSVKK